MHVNMYMCICKNIHITFIHTSIFMYMYAYTGIAEIAAKAGVTRITMLPSQLSTALRMLPDIGAIWPSLRIVTISGEACQPSLIGRFKKSLKDTTLINIYGSTEVGADVTYAVLCEPCQEEVVRTIIVCICAYIYKHIRIFMYIYLFMYTYTYIYAYLYIHICICMVQLKSGLMSRTLFCVNHVKRRYV
jgi:hypothetical protein